MMLAKMANERPTDLRADMQRFFGIDADALGNGVGAWQMSACLARMPRGSAILASVERATEYTISDTYLHAILCAIGRKWIPFPWEKEDDGNVAPSLGSIDVSEFDEWLNQDWKEDKEASYGF